MNSSALAGIAGLDNPHVSPWIGVLQPLIVTKQVSILIGQDVCLGKEVNSLSSELFLHLYIVEAHAIFPSDFIGLREMVQSLELIETFIEVSFATATSPQYIPFMRFGVGEARGLTQTPYQFSVAFQYLVQELTVVNVVASFIAVMAIS